MRRDSVIPDGIYKGDENSMKKAITAKMMILISVAVAVVSCTATYFVTEKQLGAKSDTAKNSRNLSVEELYSEAVSDAVTIEDDELHELVTVDKNSDMVTMNEENGKVLMLTYNNYPESYVPQTEFKCEYGEVWVFTDKEIISWYKDNKDGVTDWSLRLNQLIGLPPDKEYGYVSAFWVDTEDLKRPAYETDITKQPDKENLSMDDEEISEWFNDNIVWSYFDSSYPWTRLGYTYDWADNGTEYGLSEFIVMRDSVVDVEWTKTREEFIAWLEQNTSD